MSLKYRGMHMTVNIVARHAPNAPINTAHRGHDVAILLHGTSEWCCHTII